VPDQENIFSGLEKFGLSSVIDKKIEVYNPDASPQDAEQDEKESSFCIEDYIFAKNFTCTVCTQNFKSNIVRERRIRLESVEYDLRPIYSPIDPLFYDVVVCESCGYTAVQRMFNNILRRQSDLVLSEISPKFKFHPYPDEPTIDEVIARYKLALLNAVVKKAKDGERAYICMKITWLYRIKGSSLDNEKQFAELTVKGLTAALSKEHFPIPGIGLGENTALYLIAAFLHFLEDDRAAVKILSELIASTKVSKRIKDRARDLRDEISDKNKSEKLLL